MKAPTATLAKSAADFCEVDGGRPHIVGAGYEAVIAPGTTTKVITPLDSDPQAAELVAINLPTRLQYPLMDYTGALSVPWLKGGSPPHW